MSYDKLLLAQCKYFIAGAAGGNLWAPSPSPVLLPSPAAAVMLCVFRPLAAQGGPVAHLAGGSCCCYCWYEIALNYPSLRTCARLPARSGFTAAAPGSTRIRCCCSCWHQTTFWLCHGLVLPPISGNRVRAIRATLPTTYGGDSGCGTIQGSLHKSRRRQICGHGLIE